MNTGTGLCPCAIPPVFPGLLLENDFFRMSAPFQALPVSSSATRVAFSAWFFLGGEDLQE